jgi:hypothetical protein
MNIKKNFKSSLTKDINLFFILSLFWKNKIITFLSLLLSFLSFFFLFVPSFKGENRISAIVQINANIPPYVFLKVSDYSLDYNTDKYFRSGYDISKYFQESLPIKIITSENFKNFLNQDYNKNNKKIFEKYNLKINDYFANNLIETRDNNIYKYTLATPKEIDPVNFLNNYIIFSKQILIDDYYNFLKLLIDKRIQSSVNALIIAKELKLERPAMDLKDKDEFQLGEIVLLKQIEELRLKKNLLSKESLDWDPFITYAFQQKKSENSIKKYFLTTLLSFGVGTLLSLLIIFFKDDFTS